MTAPHPLKAPFPYPGGKSTIADLVWRRLGNVDNYIEPFAGSLAVLLRRPAAHFDSRYRIETANDANHYICNFWRAVARDPERVAEYADNPVIEADLHARHQWLVRSQEAEEFRQRMQVDPDYHDAKIAGWWVWGQCCWIGHGWCDKRGGYGGRPQLADAYDIGRGVNSGGNPPGGPRRPQLAGGEGQIGWGVHARGIPAAQADAELLPQGGLCGDRREWLTGWMQRLADRLRLVRICYGHWSRVCDSPSTLTRLGITGVFLDPPYPTHRVDSGKKSRDPHLYATDAGADLNALRDEVLAWCLKWGSDPGIRVALCCYEGDGYEPLKAAGWSVTEWEAQGGYSNLRKGKKSENPARERVYFSPAAAAEVDLGLFAEVRDAAT